MASSLGLAEAFYPQPVQQPARIEDARRRLGGFPTKDGLADYLESYALHFELPIRRGVKVDLLKREDGVFLATAGSLTTRPRRDPQDRPGLELARTPSVAFVDEGRSHRSHRVRWWPSRPEADRGRPPGGVPGTSS